MRFYFFPSTVPHLDFRGVPMQPPRSTVGVRFPPVLPPHLQRITQCHVPHLRIERHEIEPARLPRTRASVHGVRYACRARLLIGTC